MIIGKLDADGLKMKQITEWDNNPRMMWVWDMCEQLKEKRKVIYLLDRCEFPVVTNGRYCYRLPYGGKCFTKN